MSTAAGSRLICDHHHPVDLTEFSNFVREFSAQTKYPVTILSEIQPFSDRHPETELIQDILIDVIQEKQASHQDNPFWQGLKIRIKRSSALDAQDSGGISVRRAFESQEAYIHGQVSWNELAIDVRKVASWLKGQSEPLALKKELSAALDQFLEGKASRKELTFLDPSSDPAKPAAILDTAIHRFAESSYSILGALLDSIPGEEKGQSGLAETATREKVVEQHAQEFVKSLRSCESAEPVYLEIGAYRANGVQELLQKVYDLSADEPELREKLAKTKYVFSDFNQAALDGAEEAVDAVFAEEGNLYKELGINFEYVKLDATQDPLTTYIELGYQEIFAGRAVNVLESVGSNYIAIYDDQLYQVTAVNGLNTEKIESLLTKVKKVNIDGRTEKVVFSDSPELKSLEDCQTYPVTVDYIINTISDLPQGNEPLDFIEKLQEDFAMPEAVAVQLYRDVFRSIEQHFAYIKIDDINDYGWDTELAPQSVLEEVLQSGTKDHWIPDSGRALRVMEGVIPLIRNNPQGSFIFTQLTTDEHAIQQGGSNFRLLGIALATFTHAGVLVSAISHAGYRIDRHIGTGAEHGDLAPTSSAFIVRA